MPLAAVTRDPLDLQALVRDISTGISGDGAVATFTGLVRDHNGARYYFCCAECLPMFDADPARYANV